MARRERESSVKGNKREREREYSIMDLVLYLALGESRTQVPLLV